MKIYKPQTIKLPVVLSVPHAGTEFPADMVHEFKQHLLPPDDTDWFVDRLYDFADELGVPVIVAEYSRWVIDLNRKPNNESLYNDGRLITALCTTTDFLGNNIYIDERDEVCIDEVERRKKLYYQPYYDVLQSLLDDVKQEFGSVLLWDCHSIKRVVTSIYANPFPDLILGDADGTSAAAFISNKAVDILRNSAYSFNHNYPFKGGNITRHFGKPANNVHALQLEMAKPLYMNDDEMTYNETRADDVRILLKKTVITLGNDLLDSLKTGR